jgi:hypothetical protein
VIVKCESWPRVLPNDDGIRPAGRNGECFYCHQKIGQPHDETCVTVQCLVLYSVWANGKQVGTYKSHEPWHWDSYDMESARNESSWCASNAIDDIEWTDADAKERALFLDQESCCCSLLEFKFEKMIDNGPFIDLRESVPVQ